MERTANFGNTDALRSLLRAISLYMPKSVGYVQVRCPHQPPFVLHHLGMKLSEVVYSIANDGGRHKYYNYVSFALGSVQG